MTGGARARSLPGLARLALAGLAVAVALACGDAAPVVPPGARITDLGPTLRPGGFPVGSFEVHVVGGEAADVRLRVVHSSEPARALWESLPGRAFVGAARGRAQVRESRGSFSIRERRLERCGDQRLASLRRDGAGLRLTGTLECASERLPWELLFVPAPESSSQLRFELRLAGEAFDRAALRYAADPGERFFGFGEQFTHLELGGRRVPILVQEQGIGRGLQPLTALVDLYAGAGGSWHSSYAPIPHYLTDRLRSLVLENDEYSVFDLRAPGQVTVEVFAAELRGRILHGRTPLALVSEHTLYAGRMRALPDWIHRGAVVGLQGGTERVREAWRALEAAGAPLAAFWLQDWVGQRTTSLGKQLWWNWELDRDRYPGWDDLVRDLRRDGIRVMTYVNPFLADVAAKPNARRRLLDEARARGLLVEKPSGEPYMLLNTSFDAALLDLTNPETRSWFKQVLREEVLARGVSGWMADFGEALPWDARLASGESGARVHNRYPELWARLNREVLDEAGLGAEGVFFTRSGFTRSPRHSTLFWLGDQLVTWDRHDGMRSSLTGLLSGGLSGLSLNHGDVGGYTAIVHPLLSYRRDKELFLRWAELAAFQPVLRTHEGIVPDESHQFDSDPETLRHFARMAKLHAAWSFLRRELIAEAAARGHPVLRPLFLHHPADPRAWLLPATQFLLGADLLVAPVLEPGASHVRVYLPAGRWVHGWSGCGFGAEGPAARGGWFEVPAPIGSPAWFFREGAATGRTFQARLVAEGLLPARRPPCPLPAAS